MKYVDMRKPHTMQAASAYPCQIKPSSGLLEGEVIYTLSDGHALLPLSDIGFHLKDVLRQILCDSESDGHAIAVGCPVVVGIPVVVDIAGVSGIPTVHRGKPPVGA